jgi:hypothetical protein
LTRIRNGFFCTLLLQALQKQFLQINCSNERIVLRSLGDSDEGDTEVPELGEARIVVVTSGKVSFAKTSV